MEQSLECSAPSFDDAQKMASMQSVANAVGSVLMSRGLPCRIWSGMHAAVLGARQSQDVDVWMPDAAILPAYEALRRDLDIPVTLDEGYDDRVMIGVGEGRPLEIMACMDIKTTDGTFAMRCTRSVLNLGTSRRYNGWSIPFAPPEDTILLKAILARGADQGKHDIEDIAAIRDGCYLDQDYLMRRIAETGTAPRVSPLLIQMGVATYSAYGPDTTCNATPRVNQPGLRRFTLA